MFRCSFCVFLIILLLYILHIRTIYTTQIRVVSMRGYRTTCIPLFYCSRCLVYNSQTTLNAKVRHSQPDYDRLPIFKKKKNPSRTHQAGGRRRTGSRPVNERSGGQAAAAAAALCGGDGTVAYGFFRSM